MLSLFDIKYNTIDSTYLPHIKRSVKKAVLYIYTILDKSRYSVI